MYLYADEYMGFVKECRSYGENSFFFVNKNKLVFDILNKHLHLSREKENLTPVRIILTVRNMYFNQLVTLPSEDCLYYIVDSVDDSYGIITLFDYCMLAAKEVVTGIFDVPEEEIAVNTEPVIMGTFISSKPTAINVYVQVVASDNLTKLREGFEYKPIKALVNRYGTDSIEDRLRYSFKEVKEGDVNKHA